MRILQELPDRLKSQGKCFSLALIVCFIVLVKVTGEKTISGATEGICHRGVSLEQRFELLRANLPCETTHIKVLALVDGERLDELLRACFVRWETQSQCGDKPSC